MEADNRRQFHRISFDGQASVYFSKGSYDCCQIKNLSLTGMCVAGKFRPQKQKKCRIKIFHKEKTGNNNVQVEGEIVWTSDDGIGMRFTAMTLENYILLQTTLIAKADQPEIILREIPHDFPFSVYNH